MDWVRAFYTFRGRTSRSVFWRVSAMWFVYAQIFNYTWPEIDRSAVSDATNYPRLGLIALLAVPTIVSCLAVCVTRLHDRNKTGWWLVVFLLIPLALQALAANPTIDAEAVVFLIAISGALSIWATIELGALRGTTGANLYGPDPLQGALDPEETWRENRGS